jgi:hypothetical protein
MCEGEQEFEIKCNFEIYRLEGPGAPFSGIILFP